ncbi:hypothetical protein NT04LS_0538, partial [Listeria seeligeri FSL S4-171]
TVGCANVSKKGNEVMNAKEAYLQNIQKEIEWDTILFATKVD